jgi:hypothetical protein
LLARAGPGEPPAPTRHPRKRAPSSRSSSLPPSCASACNDSRTVSRAARKYEGAVWELAGDVLSTQQLDDLRDLIASWIVANADRGYSEAVRFDAFASGFEGAEERKATGLMSAVRHATAAADQALELAERMNYFFQRAPNIRDGKQAALLVYRVLPARITAGDGSRRA